MAERRMFARSVVFYDALPELTHSAQVLYFHLNMHADDDGLVGNPKPVMRLAQCTPQDLQELRDCELVLTLEGGAVAITHWRVHNQIRRDRYKPTRLREAFAQLVLTDSGAYRLRTPQDGCPFGNQTETQDSVDKERKGKESKGKERQGKVNTGDQLALPPMESALPFTDFEKFVLQTYQTHCTSLAKCYYLSEEVRMKICKLEKLGWTEKQLKDAFQLAGESAFLSGENKDGWLATLDWLCDGEHLRRVLAGKYQNYHKKQKTPPTGGSGLGEAELEAIQKLLEDDTVGLPS